MKTIEDLLREQSIAAGLKPEHLALLAGCGRNMHFDEGSYLAHEGDAADAFFIVRSGRMAVETSLPGRGTVTLQTLEAGDIAGWSWIFPPYKWTFDLRAIASTSVLSLDGRCLREKCERDPALGYTLMKNFAQIMTARLRAARLQLLDVYRKESV